MITPHKIAKKSEHSHQAAFFAYCAVALNHGFKVADEWCDTAKIRESKSVPQEALLWIHAVPNGAYYGADAKTRMIVGNKMKAEGLKSGVADVFLPHPIYYLEMWWHGLYIEFKKPDLRPKTNRGKGGLDPEQVKFADYCKRNNYGFMVAYDWKEAVTGVKNYVGSNQGFPNAR